MTHDQLARVFPDGRTVHVPADGNPLRGYELAGAESENRETGDEASIRSKRSLFAALFGVKSNDEDDEGAATAMAGQKSTSAGLMAAAVPAKSTEPVPMPRAKPASASTCQLASVDVQSVRAPKAKQAAGVDAQASSADKAEAKPQTPADIINARGFWDDAAAAPKQLTPAQVAAINARRALASTDPQSTASVSTAMQALAYAPASSSQVDRGNIVAASAPIPRSVRPASASRNPAAVNTTDQGDAKGTQGPGGGGQRRARNRGSKPNR